MAMRRDALLGAFIRDSVGDDEYVRVFGDVDIANVGDLKSAIDQASDSGSAAVVVDLTRCTFIGSHGIAVIARANAERRVRVLAPPQIKRVFDIAGLAGVVSPAKP